jgi:hypothetical protein
MPILGVISSGVIEQAFGAYDSLATANGTGSGSTITFTNISNYYADYDELQFRIRWAYTSSGPATVQAFMGFNGSSTVGDFITHYLRGNGSSVSATNELNPPLAGILLPGAVHSDENPLGAAIINISGYNTTNKRTTARIQNGTSLVASSSDSTISIGSGLWNQTTNVTSITFQMTGGRAWTTTTEISLYGFRKA